MNQYELQQSPKSNSCSAGVPVLALFAVLVVWVMPVQANDQARDAFNQALADRDADLLYRAIDRLEALLDSSPKGQRIRLELAVTYYRAKIFDEAERLAAQVLAETDPESEVHANVSNFLALIEKRKQQYADREDRVAYDLSLGVLHDDNANQSPEDFLGGSSIVRRERDEAFTVTVRATHLHSFPGTVRVGDRAGVLAVKSTATYYRKEYFDETDFNVDVVSVSSGPRLAVSGKYRLELPLRVDYIRLGDDPLAWFGSLSPEVTWISDYGDIKLTAILEQREYVANSSESREGARTGLALDWSASLFDKRLQTQLDVEKVLQHAEAARQEYDALRFRASAKWKWNEAWSIRSRYSFLRRDYRGSDPLLNGDNRETRQHSGQLGLEYRVQDWGWLNDWLLAASVSYTDVQANGAVYEYDRWQYNLSASRRFR